MAERRDPELEAEIEREIREHGRCWEFLAETYRELRRKGFSRRDIGYDMCHIRR